MGEAGREAPDAREPLRPDQRLLGRPELGVGLLQPLHLLRRTLPVALQRRAHGVEGDRQVQQLRCRVDVEGVAELPLRDPVRAGLQLAMGPISRRRKSTKPNSAMATPEKAV